MDCALFGAARSDVVPFSFDVYMPYHIKIECGPMLNVMAALPNVGGALCSSRKVWLAPSTGVPCSNAAKTRNPLKFAGVPQTTGPISAASGPKFTILWGHVEEIRPLSGFSDCRYVP